jgi:hypothetical protein
MLASHLIELLEKHLEMGTQHFGRLVIFNYFPKVFLHSITYAGLALSRVSDAINESYGVARYIGLLGSPPARR